MNQFSRLNYNKPTHYSNDVLLGNWFEERIAKYKKFQFKHNSLYKNDFTVKSLAVKKETDDLRNNTKITAEYGENISPPKITDDGPNYYDNFSTTYDLSYQYFPSWIHGTLNRTMRFKLLKFEPTDEYLNGYGNLSHRNGLTEFKREEWGCDVLDPRRPVLSIAKMDFIKPESKVYKQIKWPRLHATKIKCGNVTEKVYQTLPIDHPRTLESKVNPITWEGAGNDDDDLLNQKCVCKM